MRPCDCEDIEDIAKLKEQSVCFNDWEITVKPNVAIINNTQFTVKVPQRYFKYFAEWYLREQLKEA